MKWLKQYSLFKEAKEYKYNNSNIVTELCVAMLIINPNFLDNLLDKGIKGRYTEDSSVFLNDLKNLVYAKNRLMLGAVVDGKCVEDDNLGKINGEFSSVDFNVERDWNKLINARITARNIYDKLLLDEKLREEMVKAVYWLGPNKTKENNEDIIIETHDGRQYSVFVNKNLNLSKSASFANFAEDLLAQPMEILFHETYMPKWDKLAQEWVKLIYEGGNSEARQMIEKFIDPQRIDSMTYFGLFAIKHRDRQFQHLGEFFRSLDQNILQFSDLLTEIWKEKDKFLKDAATTEKEWTERKILILNSKILEHALTETLKKDSSEDITRLEDGLKLADGRIKMKLVKTVVNKLGCLDRDIYYSGNNGNVFYRLPSRKFFRDNYDRITAKFDYHVKLTVDTVEEDNNDFKFNIILELDNKQFITLDIHVMFTGGEMSGKLSAKYKFTLADDFNFTISEMSKPQE
jgi:hypothetical protein